MFMFMCVYSISKISLCRFKKGKTRKIIFFFLLENNSDVKINSESKLWLLVQ